jgi:hypothetical protein
MFLYFRREPKKLLSGFGLQWHSISRVGWVCEEGVYVLLGGTLSLDTFTFEGFGGVSGCQSFCFVFFPSGNECS